MRLATIALAAVCTVACGPGSPGGPAQLGSMKAEEPPHPLQSNDVMSRDALTNRATVQHVLIGWEELEDNYPGAMDPRAASRSRREAEALVQDVYRRAAAGEPFEALMREYSEDPGSADSGETYVVEPGSKHVFEFRRMGLRLEVGEVGKVLSSFGWHIIKRVE